MKRSAAFVACVLVIAAAFAASAAADPLNKNSETISFICGNGVSYVGVGIVQSHTSTGHVIESSDPSLLNSTFQAVQITVDGQVAKQIPGFAGRSLVNCQIVAFDGVPFSDDVIIVSGFFTGNR